jgi:hypothetical protein
MDWVLQHRADLIRSLLILGRYWFLKGCPPSKTVPALGNFTRWAQVLGGILECADITGFLGAPEVYIDPETEEWASFLTVLDEVTYSEPFTVRNLVNITRDLTMNTATNRNQPSKNNEKLRGAMPEKLAESLDRPELTSAFSVAFRQRKGRFFGDDGIHIANTGKRAHGAVLWEIKRKVEKQQREMSHNGVPELG